MSTTITACGMPNGPGARPVLSSAGAGGTGAPPGRPGRPRWHGKRPPRPAPMGTTANRHRSGARASRGGARGAGAAAGALGASGLCLGPPEGAPASSSARGEVAPRAPPVRRRSRPQALASAATSPPAPRSRSRGGGAARRGRASAGGTPRRSATPPPREPAAELGSGTPPRLRRPGRAEAPAGSGGEPATRSAPVPPAPSAPPALAATPAVAPPSACAPAPQRGPRAAPAVDPAAAAALAWMGGGRHCQDSAPSRAPALGLPPCLFSRGGYMQSPIRAIGRFLFGPSWASFVLGARVTFGMLLVVLILCAWVTEVIQRVCVPLCGFLAWCKQRCCGPDRNKTIAVKTADQLNKEPPTNFYRGWRAALRAGSARHVVFAVDGQIARVALRWSDAQTNAHGLIVDCEVVYGATSRRPRKDLEKATTKRLHLCRKAGPCQECEPLGSTPWSPQTLWSTSTSWWGARRWACAACGPPAGWQGCLGVSGRFFCAGGCCCCHASCGRRGRRRQRAPRTGDPKPRDESGTEDEGMPCVAHRVGWRESGTGQITLLAPLVQCGDKALEESTTLLVDDAKVSPMTSGGATGGAPRCPPHAALYHWLRGVERLALSDLVARLDGVEAPLAGIVPSPPSAAECLREHLRGPGRYPEGGDAGAWGRLLNRYAWDQTADVLSGLSLAAPAAPAAPALEPPGFAASETAIVSLARTCDRSNVQVCATYARASLYQAIKEVLVTSRGELDGLGWPTCVGARMALGLAGLFFGARDQRSVLPRYRGVEDFVKHSQGGRDARVVLQNDELEPRPRSSATLAQWVKQERIDADEKLVKLVEEDSDVFPGEKVCGQFEELNWRWRGGIKDVYRQLLRLFGWEWSRKEQLEYMALSPDSEGNPLLRMPTLQAGPG
ncbi:unnamed protein product [Prorocentrum cordatum]|uniref:Uncharacterized protein n=1 Tax=Prorocentrum cordatum TaxID=2364126 RepID=A0ABN9W6P8_9DINO|nr:unnamed protein product [Polarella glacialis]